MGFHEPVEARLRRVPGLHRAVPGLGRRFKSDALRADLGGAAGTARARPEAVPGPDTVAQALGVLYVLEGATLGARTLLPRLRRSGVIPGEIGDRYLTGYGADSTAMWADLVAALDRIPADREGEVTAWAARTFAALAAWRTEWDARK